MKKQCLLSILIILSLNCLAQNPKQTEIDSLLVATNSKMADSTRCLAYNQISNLYLYANSDLGIRFAKKGLELGNKINWEKGIALSHLTLSKHQISAGNFAEALKNLNVAEKIFLFGGDSFNTANTYNQLGVLKANQGKFPEALAYFFKALRNFEKTREKNTKLNIANMYQNIANIFSATENYEKAIENYDKSIALYSQIKGREVSLGMNIASKGMVFQKQKEFRQALETLKKAEEIVSSAKDESALIFIKSWLGSVYLSLEMYDLSLEYSNNSIAGLTQMGDKVLAAATIQNIGYAYLKKGIKQENQPDIKMGFLNISKSLEMNKASGNLELLLNDYRYLSEYYEYQKDYFNSLEAYKKFAASNDSIFNFRNKQSLQNLQDERTIELRDKQIQLNAITLKSKERQKWLYIFGIGFLFSIAALIFNQSRNRKKNNDKLQILNAELDQANQIKTTFFSILNHDLRSPLTNIITFLTIQKENPGLLDEDVRQQMENKTITSAENLLESMEDILLWSKGQMKNFCPEFNEILIKSLFLKIEKHFSGSDKVKISYIDEGNNLIVSDEEYLKTILRNLIDNGIKALGNTENASIEIKAWKQNKLNYISVSDNGPGGTDAQFRALYDEKEVVGIKTGLGLHLIRDLANAIHCKIEVVTNPNGTVFTLSL